VNLGGEPERDDSGLPPVDIVVPDDARELERDVQAYRREQRALRRQQRRMRWHGPLTRDGVVLPLLATCLILALIAGTLLTFFTARPGGESPGVAAGTPKASTASPPAASGQPSASATSGAPGRNTPTLVSGTKLPAQAAITVIGSHPANKPENYSGLVGTFVVLVPVNCNCANVLAELINQAANAHVLPYIVGGDKLAPATYISALVTSVDAQGSGVAQDTSGTLASNYLPAPAYAPGSPPSALLIAPDGTVSVAMKLLDGANLTQALRHLAAQVSAATTASDS
jgi:hypothetical protein